MDIEGSLIGEFEKFDSNALLAVASLELRKKRQIPDSSRRKRAREVANVPFTKMDSSTVSFDLLLRCTDMLRKQCVWISVVVGLASCAAGSTTSLTVGPTFGKANGIVASIEYTFVRHEKPESREETEQRAKIHRPRNTLGVGMTIAPQVGWNAKTGAYAAPIIAFDYFGWLAREFNVFLGGGVGVDQKGRFAALVPRVGFAVTPWKWGESNIGIGLRLEGVYTADDFAGGPRLTLTRMVIPQIRRRDAGWQPAELPDTVTQQQPVAVPAECIPSPDQQTSTETTPSVKVLRVFGHSPDMRNGISGHYLLTVDENCKPGANVEAFYQGVENDFVGEKSLLTTLQSSRVYDNLWAVAAVTEYTITKQWPTQDSVKPGEIISGWRTVGPIHLYQSRAEAVSAQKAMQSQAPKISE
jgi:hypothetical protein